MDTTAPHHNAHRRLAHDTRRAYFPHGKTKIHRGDPTIDAKRAQPNQNAPLPSPHRKNPHVLVDRCPARTWSTRRSGDDFSMDDGAGGNVQAAYSGRCEGGERGRGVRCGNFEGSRARITHRPRQRAASRLWAH